MMNFSICWIPFSSGRVEVGSLEHLVPIVIAIIFTLIVIINARRTQNPFNYNQLFQLVGVAISATVIGFHSYRALFFEYNFSEDLPLYLCSLVAILIPIYTYSRHYWMFEILLFWIIAGTLNAVITPDISEGFPSLDYFRYWIVHLGLLFVIFYSIFVLKMRPAFKSILKSFLALQLYVVVMLIVNYYLNANYFYLNEKPKSASLLDYFGDWPYYIVVVQIIIIPLFILIYLPFHLFKRRA